VPATDLVPGLESGATVSPKRGPGDGAPSEIQSDAVAVVHEFLAIDDFSANGGFLSQRSDLDYFASLPRAARNYTSAVDANVVRIGHFRSVHGLTLRLGEVHNHRDGEALVHTSVQYALCGHVARPCRVAELCVAGLLGTADDQPDPTSRSILC
jgi:hypothetical protein